MADNGGVRPSIPESMKREIRQRCGFGCVVCGLPLYEYDHMAEWAEHHRHVADEITLLCDRHHKEKTNGLLSRAQVIEANQSPYNIERALSPWYGLHYSGEQSTIRLGDLEIKSGTGRDIVALLIDDLPILHFSRMGGGGYSLNAVILDEDDEIVLTIIDNALTYSVGEWDIDWVGRTLTIREALKAIRLQLRFDPPNRVTVTRGVLRHNGIEVWVSEDGVFLPANNFLLSEAEAEDKDVLLSLGQDSARKPALLRLSNVSRDAFDRSAMSRESRLRFRESRARKAAAVGTPPTRLAVVPSQKRDAFGRPS